MFKKLVTFLSVGLLCLIALPGVTMANLVANGGFETGNFSSWTAGEVEVYNGAAKSGAYSALWQDSSPGFLSQTITTTPGQSYILEFWASPGAGYAGDDSFFKVKFDGIEQTYLDLSDPVNWSVNYQYFHFIATAATVSTQLEFSFYSAESEGWLDDVSVNAVPIPAAAWLLGTGIVGLAALRRKVQK